MMEVLVSFTKLWSKKRKRDSKKKAKIERLAYDTTDVSGLYFFTDLYLNYTLKTWNSMLFIVSLAMFYFLNFFFYDHGKICMSLFNHFKNNCSSAINTLCLSQLN